MKWIGLLIVAPFWGMLSVQFFIQAWLGVINGCINIIGFFAGRVERKWTAIGVGVGFGMAVIFSLLVSAGFWLFTEVLHFGYTRSENIVYWIFAAFSALYILPQALGRIRKTWRNAMIDGSLQEDIWNRELSKHDK